MLNVVFMCLVDTHPEGYNQRLSCNVHMSDYMW